MAEEIGLADRVFDFQGEFLILERVAELLRTGVRASRCVIHPETFKAYFGEFNPFMLQGLRFIQDENQERGKVRIE